MELNFSSDFDSAKRLDEIMNSYSGRDRGSILADEHSMEVTLVLLERSRSRNTSIPTTATSRATAR